MRRRSTAKREGECDNELDNAQAEKGKSRTGRGQYEILSDLVVVQRDIEKRKPGEIFGSRLWNNLKRCVIPAIRQASFSLTYHWNALEIRKLDTTAMQLCCG